MLVSSGAYSRGAYIENVTLSHMSEILIPNMLVNASINERSLFSLSSGIHVTANYKSINIKPNDSFTKRTRASMAKHALFLDINLYFRPRFI